MYDWWSKAKPREEAIAILDPDETWMRPVRLVENPGDKMQSGPWEVKAVKPKRGGGAMYGLGCIIGRFQGDDVHEARFLFSTISSMIKDKQTHEDIIKDYDKGVAEGRIRVWRNPAFGGHWKRPGGLPGTYDLQIVLKGFLLILIDFENVVNGLCVLFVRI